MFIKFTDLRIEGFQSIERAHISFENQGIVIVKGTNNFEDKTSSNGSGKSSIFESIIWAIYGRTSSGISDPTNRYLKSGCMVEIEFMIDNVEYKIIRSLGHSVLKSSLRIFNNGEDISGRNKTDTEKVIKNDVFPFSQDIFLSIVFLSQGFSGRLGILSPSGRKERIEVLTDTAGRISALRDSFTNLKSRYNESCNLLKQDRSYSLGRIDSYNAEILKIQNKIDNLPSDLPKESKSSLLKLYDTYTKYSNELVDKISSINSEKSRLEISKSKISNESKNALSEINRRKSEISKIESGICPTCGNKIHGDRSEKLMSEHSMFIESNSKLIDECNTKISEIEDKILEYNSSLDVSKLKYDSVSYKLKEINRKISVLDSVADIDELNNSINEYKSSIDIEDKKSKKLDKEISAMESKSSIANHCASIVSKQFRGYLLNNIIDFMNNRLHIYSDMLFSSGDTIKLEVDSTKLDIYLGDSLYDSLSGGEKRKVDIALMFTQRDLSINILGTSSNILILDEVMDNLDELATSSVLDMISRVSDSIESLFIISHNNYSIPYDTIINVVKDKDRLSRVYNS